MSEEVVEKKVRKFDDLIKPTFVVLLLIIMVLGFVAVSLDAKIGVQGERISDFNETIVSLEKSQNVITVCDENNSLGQTCTIINLGALGVNHEERLQAIETLIRNAQQGGA